MATATGLNMVRRISSLVESCDNDFEKSFKAMHLRSGSLLDQKAQNLAFVTRWPSVDIFVQRTFHLDSTGGCARSNR